MLALVLGLALTQAPPKVVVVQTSNLGVAPKRTAELTQLLLELLKAEKMDGVEAKTACDNRVCVIATSKRLEGVGAISVAFASLGKDTVMDLESMKLGDGNPIAQTTFTVKANDTKLPFEALAFVADTRRELPQSAPPTKVVDADTPKQTTVTPTNEPPKEGTTPVTAESSSSAMGGVRVGLLVATVVVGATALVMLFAGLEAQKTANATVSPDSMMSVHTKDGAVAWKGVANSRWSIATGLGATAGALALATVLTLAF